MVKQNYKTMTTPLLLNISSTMKVFSSLTLLAQVRLLKPCPVIVINSFAVPVDGVMLLIDGDKQLESSKSNLFEV